MKIAILGARRFPPGMSGIDNQVFELSKRLALRGHEVFLFVSEQGRGRHKNIHVVKVPKITKEFGDLSVSYLSYNLFSIPYIVRYIRKHRIDIIHANNPISGFAASVVKRLTGTPMVYTMRGTIPDNIKARGGRVARMLQTFEKRALARADLITAITRHIARTTSAWYGKKIVVRVIPNGIDLSRFRGRGRPIRGEFKIQKKSRVVLYIGRLVGVKGIKYLIAAMPGVIRKFPDTVLLIVGDGPLRGGLEGMAKRLGIGDKVVFAGPRKDVRDILNASDVLVLPSLHEGFPNVALEAMACGRPVIGCRVTSLPEIIDPDIGVLAKSRSSKSLEAAITSLFKKPVLIKSMGRAARMKAESYSWDRLAGVFIKEYKNILRVKK